MLGNQPNSEETDRVLNALCHSCRRRLLFELYEELNLRNGASINYVGITPYRTEKERMILYHVHLPKLEDAEYIEWNEAERTIQSGSRWEEIEPLLELIYSHLSELPPVLQGKQPDSTKTKC